MGKFKVIVLDKTEEFILSREERLRVKLLRQLRYVEEFGLSREVPNLKKVVGTPFWELRVLGRDNARLFCIERQGTVYVVYGFIKKSQKTDKRDMVRAMGQFKCLDM